MKIIITGSESFIGKKLISSLLEKNEKIIGFDLVDKSQNYDFIKIDIRSQNLEQKIPENTDVLIHLASLSSDPLCKGKSYETFDVNVLGTLNLIRAAIKKNVKQFIFASTEWVYEGFTGNEEKNEDSLIDITQHKSEYALSKLVSEMNLKQEYNNGLSNITILRFGIIYGPRKNNWAAVESIANKVKHNDEVTVGSLKTGRRFVHLDDIVQGIVSSIGINGFNIINLTGDKIITLGDIIRTSEKFYNKSINIIEKNSLEISLRNPSNKKAKKILKWKPEINLENGLKSIDDFI
jgi:nucleoside-diphosphate-sugar epimerase